jgi:uncharacterized protein (TIRG00374 family)
MNRALNGLLLGLGLVVLAALFWQFGTDELRLAVQRAQPARLAVYLVLAGMATVGCCLRWRAVTQALGAPVALSQLVSARLAGDAVGNLVPSGKLAGEAVRIGLLYGRGESGTAVSAGVAVDRVIEIIANMICFVVYVAVFATAHATGAWRHTAAAAIAVMLALLLAVTVPLLMLARGRRPLAPLYRPALHRWLPRASAWLPIVRRFEDQLLTFFQRHPAVFGLGLLGSLAIEGLIITEYHVLLTAFGIALDLPTLLLVMVGSGVARIAPTPSALGALEATQVGVLALAGGRAETGFLVGLAIRLHEAVWIAIGLLLLFAHREGWARIRQRFESRVPT